jgi:hypothetical protein
MAVSFARILNHDLITARSPLAVRFVPVLGRKE